MKLLLDEGVPMRSASLLRDRAVDASHVLELGLRAASDRMILDHATKERAVVITLDSDFHQLLAESGVIQPSVVRLRIQGLSHLAMADRIEQVIQATRDDLAKGVAVSVDEHSIRMHELPLRG